VFVQSHQAPHRQYYKYAGARLCAKLSAMTRPIPLAPAVTRTPSCKEFSVSAVIFPHQTFKVKVVIAFEVKRRIHLIEAGDIKRQSSQNFTNIPHLTGRLSSRDLKAPRFGTIYPQP
jgi:phosphatidylserine decarboxylase